MQNVSKMIAADSNLAKIVNDLPYTLDEYDLKIENKSTFLDVGAGFGKPVFHAAMQSGCWSQGVEIVPARVAFCADQKCNFEDYYLKKNQPKPTRGRKGKSTPKSPAKLPAASKDESKLQTPIKAGNVAVS